MGFAYRGSSHKIDPMSEEITAYIAMGSNLGDRAATLMSALKALAEVPGIEIRRISQFIETEPVGGSADQPKFINGAAEIRTSLAADDLLKALQETERAHGRDRQTGQRFSPRTCDLDILLMGQTVLETESLTIPHPRMHLRRFVLEPLVQIAPEAVHPVLGRTIAELLAELGEDK